MLGKPSVARAVLSVEPMAGGVVQDRAKPVVCRALEVGRPIDNDASKVLAVARGHYARLGVIHLEALFESDLPDQLD